VTNGSTPEESPQPLRASSPCISFWTLACGAWGVWAPLLLHFSHLLHKPAPAGGGERAVLGRGEGWGRGWTAMGRDGSNGGAGGARALYRWKYNRAP
jgi:hypothetical protein